MFDLIVVGGGPDGSSAAGWAGKLGLKTHLVEKEQFPRYKACGGAVTEQALSHLDFDLPPGLREATILAARVHYGASSIEARMDSPLAYTVSRSAFDTHLLDTPGAFEVLCRAGGADRIVFGSGTPERYFESAANMLNTSELTPEQRRKISQDNLREFLGQRRKTWV